MNEHEIIEILNNTPRSRKDAEFQIETLQDKIKRLDKGKIHFNKLHYECRRVDNRLQNLK